MSAQTWLRLPARPDPSASPTKTWRKLQRHWAWNSTTKSLRRLSGSCQWSKDQCTKIWFRWAQVFDSSSLFDEALDRGSRMSKEPTPAEVASSQQSGKAESRTSLARTLGRSMATLMTAAMIIGTGIFGAIGSATAKAGSGILIAMVLGGLIALATGISAAQLGVNYPKEGGAFTWAREFNHKTIGFIAGCAYLGKGIFSLSVISLAFAAYSVQIIPSLPLQLFAGVAILAVVVLNLFHVRLTTKVLITLMIVNVSLLGLFVAFSTPAVNPGHFSNLLGDNGPFGVLAGAAIFFWTWDGFMRTAILAGEIKNPRRTIPVAIVGGI